MTGARIPANRYYEERLSAERLREVYEVAPPRARAYLEGEIAFLAERVPRRGTVLELGCGYGRVLERLAAPGRRLAGIDTSHGSLRLARRLLPPTADVRLALMNAVRLGIPDAAFDCVFCVQNGISAFHVERHALVREALRVTRPGGTALFSSYAERFWEGRLEWFRAQASRGLLGPIDEEKTGNGVIVCVDGFRATTVGPDGFRELVAGTDTSLEILEIADSSVFCVLSPSETARARKESSR
jgi:2-polyprenyl-6-hydroxyphenyl methylase/3-demethylubiquinone-9 3-methyltransferase